MERLAWEPVFRPLDADCAHVCPNREGWALRTTLGSGILPPSMLQNGSPFRLFVSLLLAVSLPFCCCNFRNLLGGSGSCHASSQASHSASDGESHASHRCHEGRGHEAGHGYSGDSEKGSSAPCSPGEEKHDCKCGKSGTQMVSVEKAAVDFPADVVIAIVAWASVTDVVPTSAQVAPLRDLSAPIRPPTSLLRLHCALIV